MWIRIIASWVLNFNQNTSSNQLPKTKRMSIRPTLETPAVSLFIDLPLRTLSRNWHKQRLYTNQTLHTNWSRSAIEATGVFDWNWTIWSTGPGLYIRSCTCVRACLRCPTHTHAPAHAYPPENVCVHACTRACTRCTRIQICLTTTRTHQSSYHLFAGGRCPSTHRHRHRHSSRPASGQIKIRYHFLSR